MGWKSLTLAASRAASRAAPVRQLEPGSAQSVPGITVLGGDRADADEPCAVQVRW